MHHPVRKQEGEISFCAYNNGVGWRHIVEKMHMTATLTSGTRSTAVTRFMRAAKERGSLDTDHTLVLRSGSFAAGKQTDLTSWASRRTPAKRSAARESQRGELAAE